MMKKRDCLFLFLIFFVPLLCACHKHTYTERVVPPTCTEQGYTEYVCSDCGESYRERPVEALGHDSEEHFEDAACNEHTKTVSTCKNCGFVSVSENEEMGSIHTFQATVQYPDRVNQGYTKQTCIHCDTSYLENFTDPVDFSVGLSYTRVGAKYYVSGIGSCTDTDVIIPRVSEMGYPVAGILSKGLNSISVKTVTVQDGVYDIRSGAFEGCISLTSITLPALADVGESALGFLPKLESLTMPMAHPLVYYFERDNGQYDTHYRVYQSENGNTLSGFIPLSLKRVTVLLKVVPYAFSGCKSLQSVSLDSRIDSLPVSIFSECTSLKEVSYSDALVSVGSRAFYNCYSLESITLPDTVENIGTYAFSEMQIRKIALPAALRLTERDVGLFQDCFFLEEIRFGGDLNMIPATTFSGCRSLFQIQLPDSVTFIGGDAFRDCEKLTYCPMPKSLKTVGSAAFSGTSLLTLEFSSSLQTMGEFAFRYCTHLTSVDLEETALTQVASYAFDGCSQLSSVKLPKQVQVIGNSAFTGTDLGKNPLVLPDTLTSIGGSALPGANIEEFCPKYPVKVGPAAFAGSTLKKLVLPEGTTKIEYHAFGECRELVEVVLPSTLTEIDYNAFENCVSLEQITLPEGLKILGNSVFRGCSRLQSVTLPESLSKVGYSAFENCFFLEEIVIPKNVASIGTGAFRNCKRLRRAVFEGESTALGNSLFADAIALETLELPSELKAVPTYFCQNAVSLKSVILPATVTNVYSYAFDGCAALESVDFSGSVALLQDYCFRNCVALARVVGSERMPAFATNNFEGTPLLIEENGLTIVMGRLLKADENQVPKSLTVPQGVTYVNAGAFHFCTNLEEVIFPEGLTYIGTSAFADCYGVKRIVLPDSLEGLVANSLSGASNLEEIVIGSGMKIIDSAAFRHSYDWLTVTYRGTVEEWRSIVGHDSDALKKWNVICTDGTVTGVLYETDYTRYQVKMTGDGVLTITGSGVCEFYASHRWPSATHVTKLVIGEGIEQVRGFNGQLFSQLVNLEEVELPSTLTLLRPSDFAGTPWYEELIGEAGNTLMIGDHLLTVSPLTQGVFEVPETVKLIGGYAFEGCELLTEIKLPNGLEEIGEKAFLNCQGIEQLEIPGTVTTIGKDAFENCKALTELILPHSVRSISRIASYCDSLRRIELLGVTDVGLGIASGCPALEVVILSEGIKSLPVNTLYDCDQLQYVLLPSTLEEVDHSAFWNTPAGAKYLCPNAGIASILPKIPGLSYVYSETLPETQGLWWHYGENGEFEIYS